MRPILIFSLLLSGLFIYSIRLVGQSFEVIPPPAWHALSVSPDGKAVVGTTTGGANIRQGFLWKEGDSLTLLGFLPGDEFATARSVANEGDIVFGRSYNNDGGGGNYSWTPEHGLVNFGLIYNLANATITGISSDGTVVTGTRPYPGNTRNTEAFRWTSSGGTVGLGFLPDHTSSTGIDISADGNAITGSSVGSDATKRQAFRWTQATGMIPLGSFAPHGISADATTVVGTIAPFFNNGVQEAVRWTASTGMVGLGHLPGHIASEALAVSGNGSVVVGRSRISHMYEAVIWTEPGSARLLQEVLSTDYGIDLPGWRLWQANDISEDGSVIVGWGTNPQGQVRSFRATIKPQEEKPLVVNSIADRPNTPGETNCDTGQLIEIDGVEVPECTLRAALEAAAVRGGENPITFNIPGSGPHTISLQSMLPDVPAQTILDATTQPNYNGTPLIAINGSNALSTGLNVSQGQTIVKGFSLGGFTGAGIAISGPGQNVVEGCYIGVAPDGVTPTPNEAGILIINSKENIIGGEEPESRNVISGNFSNGLVITGEATTENHVFGNYIGTSHNGNEALPNGGPGILVENAPSNLIGGAAATHRNLISGNLGSGIVVTGTDATENQILGNYIGVNAQGTQPLGNEHHGILIEEGASQTIIGGSTSTTGMPPGNVISGNAGDGIKMVATGELSSPKNRISGNIIGLNTAGNSAIGNGGRGIQITGRVTELEIGGPTPGLGNLVSGHAETQIELLDEENEASPAAPYIANNMVGVSITGNAVIKPRASTGIKLGSTGRLIADVGVPDIRMEDNLVAGNDFNILIMGELTGRSEISGNTIGLLRNGNIAIADSAVIGLWILGGKDMQIGRKEKPNVIGGHTIGLFLAGDHNRVSGNRIGTNEAGTQARPNYIGLFIPGVYKQLGQTIISPTGFRNFIGLELDDEGEIQEGGNIISGNKLRGIAIVPEFGGDALKSGGTISGSFLKEINIPHFNFKAIETDLLKNNSFSPADSNIIAGNLIGLSASEGPLGNGKSNIEDERGGGIEISRGNGNYIIMNKIGDNGIGIAVYRDPSFPWGPGNTFISGNDIGTRLRDTILTPRPNQSSGIVHLSSSHLYIGIKPSDPLMQYPNVIAQNGQYGVLIRRYAEMEPGESNITLRGNFMAANKEVAYIVGVDAEQTGGDVPGVPFPPELLLITVDSARVTLAGKAPQTGEVDLYTGKPDHYGENAISTRHYKKTITLEGATEFQLNESLDTLAFKEGEYVSATLNVSPVDEFFMTSHFSPAIRVAKKENTIIKAVEDSEIGELINGWGIEISREENSEKSSPLKEGRSGTLYLAFHNLAPEFNTFTGQALSPDGETLIEPDTLLLYHYWTLTTDAMYTNDYRVCITLPGNKTNPGINEMILVQRYRTGAPWYALETFASSQPGTLCASGLYAMGDFSVGYHAGIITNTYSPVFSQKDRVLFNYPNPFRHETTITLNLKRDGDAFVRLLDVQGRLVKEIFNGHLHQGEHQFTLSADGLVPGIYILQAGNTMEKYISKVIVGGEKRKN